MNVELLINLYELYELYEEFEDSVTQKRRWWVRDVNLNRNELGFFTTCFNQMKLKDEEHFFKPTRLSVTKFEFLLNVLKDRLVRHSRRKPIAPEDRLAVTLMFLAHGVSPQILAWCIKWAFQLPEKSFMKPVMPFGKNLAVYMFPHQMKRSGSSLQSDLEIKLECPIA